MLIRIDYHEEHEYILLLKHILLNEHISNSNRSVWLVFHLQRNLLNQVDNDVIFNGWPSIMINNLNDNKLIPQDILMNPSYLEFVNNSQFRVSGSSLGELIGRCLTKIRYTIGNQQYKHEINDRRNRLIASFTGPIKENENERKLYSIIEDWLSKLMQIIPFSNCGSYATDWRYHLLTTPTIIGSSRSFDDALHATFILFYDKYLLLLFGHLEQYSFIDTYNFLSNENNRNIPDDLYQIWNDCLISTFETVDRTMMNRDVIDISLFLDLHLPCATIEYGIIRQIRDTMIKRRQDDERITSDELASNAMKQLTEKSTYKKNISLIFDKPDLFMHYYQDQIILAQDEAKVYQLPISFVQHLLTSNRTRSVTEQMKHLLTNHVELFEVLRVFEISMQLIGKETFMRTFMEQSIQRYTSDEAITGHNIFYTLVHVNENSFALIPPNAIMNSEDEFSFECDGDPWIETSLMNLIELLVSSTTIGQINNIEELTNCYNRVAQSILGFDIYEVNNLEKLRSYASLVRSITALYPSEQAKHVFENSCDLGGFNASFRDCNAIDEFIKYLCRMFDQNAPTTDDVTSHRHRTLLKLEMEFLKNWLPDNNERYPEVLTLLSKPQNDLWQYSSKILSFIDQEVELCSSILSTNGQLQDSDQFEILDECLQNSNDDTHKLERLLVNRTHMKLIFSVNEQGKIDKILTEHYEKFQDNVRQLHDQQSYHNTISISLIAWIKFYIELYAAALNNKRSDDVMVSIDQFLSRDEPRLCSTLKLFVIKQMCELSKITLDRLREIFSTRNTVWIRTIFEDLQNQQINEAQQNLILPTPLFECQDTFQRISNILMYRNDLDHLRQLINDCSTNQTSSYCFLLWFVHYYSRFYTRNNMQPEEKWNRLFKVELQQQIRTCFDKVGFELLVNLCKNFSNTSYFRLQRNMQNTEVHQRLIALNVVAYLISCKSSDSITYFGSLLFDNNCQMPNNYSDYIQSSVCLPGLLSSDPAIKQMLDVKTRIKERLAKGEIFPDAKFIYRCSNDCPWVFYFEGCGRPVDRSKCPLCRKDIGAQQYNKLLVRTPPQIQMPIDDGYQYIDDYMKKYNEGDRFGCYSVINPEESNVGEKPEHLNRSVSFRFMHMLSHATLLLLYDFEILTNTDRLNRDYFQKHFEKDCVLIGQQCGDIENYYVWLFKLINHMLDDTFLIKGVLNQNQKVIDLEKLIEERLIFAHINSIPTEINEYKRSFAEYMQKQSDSKPFEYFVDELFEDENRYPLLPFFNVTNIFTTNPIEKFLIKLKTTPYSEKIYPITTFLMERLEIYENIQYLYPIVTFTNYLIHKFNHRLKRNDAAEKTIEYYLTNGSDCETTSKLYEQFLNAWYKLSLKEVRFNCQVAKLEHAQEKEKFAENTMIAVVLLNASKDATSILLAACLKTIGQLQNEVVNYFHNIVGTDPTGSRRKEHAVPVQSIREEHLFKIDVDVISQQLITDSFMINYEYGKSREIIYDYDEIELALRNKISNLPIIDTDKLQYLNYQFELHGENSSLITDVRMRVKQEALAPAERKKLKSFIEGMDKDEIVNYLGSLDYVFTYLRDIDMDPNAEAPTIQTFVENHIRWQNCLSDYVRRKAPFSTIHLKYIINLYELLEECVFDQVLRDYVKKAWCEESFSVDERKQIIERFISSTFAKPEIATSLQNIDCWIGILKRVMIRVLSNVNVDIEVPLQYYLERKDLWTGDITDADIMTFDLDEKILLYHTFIILKGLEKKQKPPLINAEIDVDEEPNTKKKELKTVDTEMPTVAPWMIGKGKTTGPSVKPIETTGEKKKRRMQ